MKKFSNKKSLKLKAPLYIEMKISNKKKIKKFIRPSAFLKRCKKSFSEELFAISHTTFKRKKI